VASYKQVDQELMQLISDSYYGTGGFEDGSYLVKAEKELPADYAIRKENTNYPNYMQQVVDANIKGVFNNVNRDAGGNALLELFLKDCDGNSSSFETTQAAMGLETELYGCSILILDADKEIPVSLKGVKEGKKYPKYFKLNKKEIIEYELNGENNLTYFRFKSGETAGGTKEYTVYDNGVYYVGAMGKGSVSKTSSFVAETMIEAQHKPFIHTFETYPDPWTLPISRYGTVARISKVLYNYEGMINRQASDATFSILWNPNAALENNATFTMHTIWNSKTGDGTGQVKPEFLSPENSIKELSERANELKLQIYETTNMNVLSTSADASGDSRTYSDIIRIEGLQAKSRTMLATEMYIINLFLEMSKTSADYKVLYPNDFASGSTSEQLGNITVTMELGVSEYSSQLLRIRAMALALPALDQKTKEKIETEEYANVIEFDIPPNKTGDDE
jgi:hypothetical protein